MSEPAKDYSHDHHHQDQQQPLSYQYGTFQGVNNYPPPVNGFPQPVPPPGASVVLSVNHYVHGYQTVPGYAIVGGRPIRQRRLPCCGIGVGWFLFLVGFFLAAIPWYIGAFVLMCARYDHREKPGFIMCLIAAMLVTIAVIFGVTSDELYWD